nr:MAG TPA: Geminivirus AL2 protein [Caudoviricetes sp.]
MAEPTPNPNETHPHRRRIALLCGCVFIHITF